MPTPARAEVHPRENAARVVWELAWPAVALNSLQVVNNILDRGFIGHLEPAALSAQSASMTVTFMMFSLAAALGVAATALVSRAFGAGNVKEFQTAGHRSVSVSMIAGVIFALVAAGLASFASHVMLPPDKHRAIFLMTQFVLVYSLSLPATFIIQALAGSLRAIGDTKSPMVISGAQIGIHIVLNFLFIFPPRTFFGFLHVPGLNLGLVGAALALTVSATISAAAYLAFSGKTPLGPCWRFTMPSAEWMTRIFRIALPAAGQAVLRVFSLVAFTVVLASVPNGTEAIGAMGVGFAIESVMFMPTFGLSIAAATLVGQSLGMKRPDRAELLTWTAAHHAGIVTAILAVPLLFFAPAISDLVIAIPADLSKVASAMTMRHESTVLIRWLCATEIGFAYAMVTIHGMQGAGDTVRPTWITILTLWCLRVPLAAVLALSVARFHFPIPFTHWRIDTGVFAVGIGLGTVGAWIAMSASQLMQGILACLLFKQGKWKTMKV